MQKAVDETRPVFDRLHVQKAQLQKQLHAVELQKAQLDTLMQQLQLREAGGEKPGKKRSVDERDGDSTALLVRYHRHVYCLLPCSCYSHATADY